MGTASGVVQPLCKIHKNQLLTNTTKLTDKNPTHIKKHEKNFKKPSSYTLKVPNTN